MSAYREALSLVYEAVNRNGGFLARCDSVDDEGGAGVGVTADKDIALACLEGELVGLGKAALVCLDRGPLENLAPIGGLANGGYHGIEPKLFGLALEGFDLKSAGLVLLLRKLHLLNFKGSYLAPFTQNFQRAL